MMQGVKPAAAHVLALVLAAGLCDQGCATAEPTTEAPPRQPPGHQRMLALLEEILDRTPDEHRFFGTREARELRARLAQAGGDAPWDLLMYNGVAELRLGHEREAIDLLTRAREKLLTTNPGVEAQVLSQVDFYLATAWLRHGETQNCCERRTGESCILPLRGGGLHRREEGSRNAVRYLTEVLEKFDRESVGHLSALWLLNICHMTLGSYPDGVPAAQRLPPESFRTPIDFPRFPNIAARLGLDVVNQAGGMIADDFDGDGYLDVVISNMDTAGQLRYFRNQRDGAFAERTAAAGLTGLYGGLNLVQADYDNDGDVDILVLRGAWLEAGGRHPDSLLQNHGDGTFTDVTFDAGLGQVHYPSQTAAWADYDNDGDLDVYVGNETTVAITAPGQLFRNNGDGTFTDVAESAGVQNLRFAKGVVWGDYDGDRLPDLYVSNNGQENRLYQNRGDGTFADVAPALGVTRPIPSFPTWFWDFDNDGALDLFVASYRSSVGELAAYHLGLLQPFETPALYRGDGKGGFRDVTRETGLARPLLPMGANFGDLDGDGWLDFYLGTGDPEYFTLMPNVMFLGQAGRRFVDVTMAGAFGHLQKGHAIAFADLDNDGDQDVLAQMGGAWPGDKFADALFENPGFGGRWITVQVVGRRSNRGGIGARIRVEIEEAGATRSIYRHVTSGGSFGASPLRQSIGLGRAERIRVIEVFWPTTGETQLVSGVGLDRAIRVVEGQAGFTELPLERLVLGGAPAKGP